MPDNSEERGPVPWRWSQRLAVGVAAVGGAVTFLNGWTSIRTAIQQAGAVTLGQFWSIVSPFLFFAFVIVYPILISRIARERIAWTHKRWAAELETKLKANVASSVDSAVGWSKEIPGFATNLANQEREIATLKDELRKMQEPKA